MVFCSISVNVLPKMYSDNKKMEMTGQFWMSRLADDISLSDLNIPGTHNSAARYEPFPKTAKCQRLSLTAQLQAGVRFFDIRCHHKKDLFQEPCKDQTSSKNAQLLWFQATPTIQSDDVKAPF